MGEVPLERGIRHGGLFENLDELVELDRRETTNQCGQKPLYRPPWSEPGTYQSSKAKFWPSLSGENPQNLFGCSLQTRQRRGACKLIRHNVFIHKF
jgi:hypothetical protein